MLPLYRVFFVLSLFVLLSLKENLYIIAAILLLFTISYRDVLKISKKVIKSLLFFNLGITLGYIVLSLIKKESFLEYILYINLKVFVLTYFVAWFFARVDLVNFFSFSKELSYLLSITLSQIYSYKKSFEDFRLSFKARVIKKIREREKSFILKVFDFFLTKATKDSKERALAMRARGFFD